MGKQAIVDKILSDAREKASETIAEQQRKADAVLSAAKERCEAFKKEQAELIKRETEELLSRQTTVAELDARKLVSKKKADILGQVFDRTLEKLVSLPDAQYKKLLVGMLSLASDGDTVTLDERGRALIGEEVKNYAKRNKISLRLSEEKGNFAGGMILSGGGIDKNLTFEVEVALLKEEYEAVVAKEIFG